MLKPVGPRKPNCDEMIDWLIDHNGYSHLNEEELRADKMLNIVANSCNVPIDQVVAILLGKIKHDDKT